MQPLANQALLEWSRLGLVASLLVYKVFYGALAFMVLAFLFKIRHLLKLPAAVENTPPRGARAKAIRYAYLTLILPGEIESQVRNWSSYVEFALFHFALAVAIGTAITLPLAHNALRPPVVVFGLQCICIVGVTVGIIRLADRLTRREKRAISSPDDYFCPATLTLWMAAGVSAISQKSELGLLVFYGLATFLLFYAPFSKISHFMYWPFIRYEMGKHFGHRGVYPKKRVSAVG